MNHKNPYFIILLFALLSCPIMSSAAEVYMWIDANGGRHVTDQPPENPAKMIGKETYKRDSPEEILKYRSQRETLRNRLDQKEEEQKRINRAQEESKKYQERQDKILSIRKEIKEKGLQEIADEYDNLYKPKTSKELLKPDSNLLK